MMTSRQAAYFFGCLLPLFFCCSSRKEQQTAPDLEAEAEEKFAPPPQILRYGHSDWPEDVKFNDWGDNRFRYDEQGNRTFFYKSRTSLKPLLDDFNGYHIPDGVAGVEEWSRKEILKREYSYKASSTREVKKGTVIVTMDGYLYRVTEFEEYETNRGVPHKGGTYRGVVLELIETDDALYGGRRMNHGNLHYPIGSLGKYCRNTLEFHLEDNVFESVGDEKIIVLRADVRVYSALAIPLLENVRIEKGSVIPMGDVGLKVVDIVLPDAEQNREGWVEVTPGTFPLRSPVPRSEKNLPDNKM